MLGNESYGYDYRRVNGHGTGNKRMRDRVGEEDRKRSCGGDGREAEQIERTEWERQREWSSRGSSRRQG